MELLNRRREMGKHDKCPYVSDGLLLWYDSIWNNGIGKHSDSGVVWKELMNTGYDFLSENWTSGVEYLNGDMSYYISGAGQSNRGLIINNVNLSDMFIGKDTFTLEVITKNTTYCEYVFDLGGIQLNIGSGNNYIQSPFLLHWYRTSAGGAVRNTRYSVGSTIRNNLYKIIYNNNVYETDIYRLNGQHSFTSSIYFRIGWGDAGTKQLYIYSVRLYDHSLTDNEINQNFLIDKQRFNL